MKPRALTDVQAEQLYQDYLLFLQNSPKKLQAKYGICRSTLTRYVRRLHRRAA